MIGNIIVAAMLAFMILMILWGYKRGLVRMAFSLCSVIIVLVLVNVLTPITKDIIKSTSMYDMVEDSIQEYIQDNINSKTEDFAQTGVKSQRKIINGLPLPNEIKKTLKENNTEKGYKALKVDSFTEYIAESLGDMIAGAAAFIILFVIISILLRVLMRMLDIFTKLPIIHFFNTAGGAIIGLVESVVVVWIICIVVTAFSSTKWGQEVSVAIAENPFLSFVYDNNFIQQFILDIF